MNSTALQLDHAVVKRADRIALDIESIRLACGALGLLLGPNGAGKTTTLRLAAGLERASPGHVEVLGVRWETLGPPATLALRRRIGFSMQRPYMLSTSVRRNVEYPLRARGVARSERHDRAEAMMKSLGIDGIADRSALELSVGEMMRLSVARAAVSEPELLLLDEPFANVEPRGLELVDAVIRAGVARGATVVVSSQGAGVCADLSVEVFRLDKGRVVV